MVIELPYCKPDDVPEEARIFKRLILPMNLDKFVKFIHNVNYLRFFGVSNKDFIDSIDIAMMEIPQERPSSPKNAQETGKYNLNANKKKNIIIKHNSLILQTTFYH